MVGGMPSLLLPLVQHDIECGSLSILKPVFRLGSLLFSENLCGIAVGDPACFLLLNQQLQRLAASSLGLQHHPIVLAPTAEVEPRQSYALTHGDGLL
ncbi:MAG: hypothetical protein ACK55D_04615 [Synechococcaceae cyanobacterium]|jgi:hypothetical protein